jgi:toxin HigB-1
MIVSFGNAATEDLYHGRSTAAVRRYPAPLLPAALRKLDMLNAAGSLDDLRAPPANRLETLKGDRHGCHSIRVNKQWRIVFRWQEGNCHEVLLIDYH